MVLKTGITMTPVIEGGDIIETLGDRVSWSYRC